MLVSSYLLLVMPVMATESILNYLATHFDVLYKYHWDLGHLQTTLKLHF